MIHSHKKNEAGFTLVELAIVMIIIGLLLGGVLKGQELIANAQVTNLTSQLKGFQAAHTAFLDRYGSAPGDLPNAATRIAGCTGVAPVACNTPANPGDNSLNQVAGTVVATVAPAAQYFLHMYQADLIGSMDGTVGAVFGQELPTTSIGGGFLAGDAPAGAAGGFAIGRRGFYIVHTAGNAAVAAGTGLLTPNQAASVDRKVDDGDPSSGVLLGDTNVDAVGTPGCLIAAAGAYAEASQNGNCSIAYRTF